MFDSFKEEGSNDRSVSCYDDAESRKEIKSCSFTKLEIFITASIPV